MTEALEWPGTSCATLTGTPSERSRVAQVVEAHIRKFRTPEEELEAALYEVRGIEERTCCAGKEEAGILPESLR